jgi:hypothetical protein
VVGHRVGRCAPTSRVKALDELLDFPHLNVLFRLVLTHFFYSTNTRLVETCGRESRGLLLTFDEGQMLQSFYFIQPSFRAGYPRYLHLLTTSDTHHGAETGQSTARTHRPNGTRKWTDSYLQDSETSCQQTRPSEAPPHRPCWCFRNRPAFCTSRGEKLYHCHA